MQRIKYIAICTIISGLLLAAVWPKPALADDPTWDPYCPSGTDAYHDEIDFESLNGGNNIAALFDGNIASGQWEYSGTSGPLGIVLPDGVKAHRLVVWGINATNNRITQVFDDENDLQVYGEFNFGSVDPPEAQNINLSSYPNAFSIIFARDIPNVYLKELVVCATATEEPTGTDTCSLVDNANFATTGEEWLLDGTAAIDPVSSTLTLAAGDAAAQNLTTLQSNLTYDAVVSITQVTAPASLKVILGAQNETLDIASPGRYTATLTTPQLAGPIAYGLQNQGSGSLVLDFTCVSLATDNGQHDCLAPDNGTFETDQKWNWYRGAKLFYPGKYASLPLAELGMIGSQQTYTMPTLAEGEHLLLGFSVRSLGDSGAIAGQVANPGSNVSFNFPTYRSEYNYETSLDDLAGSTGVQFSFVNPGSVITGVVSSDDIVLDNVCAFVANRGPQNPTPKDPDATPPIDLGFNYTSCDDIDGLLAGFGVNIQQYRAEYEAGVSLWDPSSWVPWLVAAIWNVLATYLCLFMAVFVTLVDLLEYLLNNFLNVSSWVIRQWPLFVQWLVQLKNWLFLSINNLSNAYGAFLAAWAEWIGRFVADPLGTIAVTLTAASNWIGVSLANLSNAIGQALAGWSEWIGNYLAWASGVIAVTLAAASNWLGVSLANLSNGLATFLANWSNWIGVSLANLSDWIGQTLTDLFNWLVTGALFNPIRELYNWITEHYWDAILVPSLSLLLAAVAVFPLGTSLFMTIWNLLVMLFTWIWMNVFVTVNIPIRFYYAFNDGVQTQAFSNLMSCANYNFWCGLLAGVQLVNQTVGHTILYPVVIVGIILTTIAIFWKHIWALFSFNIR